MLTWYLDHSWYWLIHLVEAAQSCSKSGCEGVQYHFYGSSRMQRLCLKAHLTSSKQFWHKHFGKLLGVCTCTL